MVQKKNSVWEEIATNFNACAETGSRSSKQLRVLYENIKRETKKNCGGAACKSRISAIAKK
jgi:CRISPR/Cas system CSM-associated protein Csm2 small subunit